MERRTIAALTASMFMISTSMGIANPIVPIYAESLGATYTDLGLIGVAWSAPYCVFPVLSGLWSDRIGRLKTFLVGVLLCTVIPLLFTFSSSPLHLALIRLLHGFGMSFLWVPSEALISDLTSEQDRTRYIGLFNFSWALGYFIGPLISAAIVEHAKYQGVFMASFVVGAFSTPMLALAGRDVKANGPPRRDVMRQALKAVVKGASFYSVVMGSSVVLAVVYSLYPVYLTDLRFSEVQVSTVMGVIAASRALGFWSVNFLSSIGESALLLLGLTVQTTASFLIAYSHGYWEIILLMALLGYAVGVQIPPATSAISRLASRGSSLSLGIMEAMFGVGWVIGPGVGGVLADATSCKEAPYLFMSLASCASLACFLHAAREHRKAKTKLASEA
ncbi:MAG: MFS transporter [Candidatus Nezhaarchaeota archaeon]|nr:MFS transporter [Candidatus Nezhaarchaeota archaeon]